MAAAPPAFRHITIGPAPRFRPTITNVQIVDLDGDGAKDVVACDSQASAVFCYRRGADGAWTEEVLGRELVAPAHATVVDLDGDGDNDVVVSVMGDLYPDDEVVGSLVLLENRGGGKFEKRVLLDDVRRVADAQPADFDGDGDVDLAVAVFGYLRGQVLWLENRGDLKFRDHELLSAAGTIHVPVADFDGDGDPDIAAVVSQEEEAVWGFENVGGGRFKPRILWSTINNDIGSAGLVKSDLDGDGDVDLLLPVGDNLEDAHSLPQPYHGCLWVENRGGWKFAAERIATFPGTYAADAGDLDADGDQDVVLVSMVNDWSDPTAPSIVWLENTPAGKRPSFAMHAIANDPIVLVTVACGDLDADGRTDVAAGGLHMYPPYERVERISAWLVSDGAAAGETVGDVAKPQAAAGDVEGPPLPDLKWSDALTRRDLAALHDRVAASAADGKDAVDDWLALAKAYYAYGYFREANVCSAQAAKVAPQNFVPQFLLAAGTARVGDMAGAIRQFERAMPLADAKQKPWVHYEIGRTWLRLEESKEAEAAFAAAGDYDLALWQLAKLRVRAGRAADAAAPLAALVRLQPGAIETCQLQARAADAAGNVSLAARLRDRAEYNSRRLPADPIAALVEPVEDEFGAAKLMGEARKAIGARNWDAAAKRLAEVLQATGAIDANVLSAGVAFERGEPKQTIEILERLAEERGVQPQTMALLGDAYLAAGDSAKAAAAWELGASVHSAPAFHDRLAKQREAARDKAGAKRERALALEARGVAAMRVGNVPGARQPLQSAVAIEPALPRAWFYLGECLRLTGDSSGARKAYQKTLELAPNHGRALAALARMGK